ncbi:citrate/2-methylcitrate synthase [Thalassoglobus sp. JC818]|uniref:citrate/2-methylcitrate synthase n=1 Tax=Thalassoglobus sp. JC818 TaxID=3232136 RepID=UPI0034589840
MAQEIYHPGLRGVIAGETEICRLDDGIQYRGYCLHELSEGASFLEVAYLLLFDELPSEEQFADFLTVINEEQQLPPIIEHMFERIPVHNSPLEVLRTGIGLLSHFDPQPSESLLCAGHTQTIRLMARIPLLIGCWHRSRLGLPVLQPKPELSYISNVYYVITGEVPSSLFERALDVAFVVCAEHEFNPSTYVARIVGSTRCSQYGPILAALDAFIGMSHGGGGDGPLDLLDEVREPSEASKWISQQRANAEFPGFGHPVYQECDPRASILEVECERLARASNRQDMEKLAEEIERVIWEERQLPPNVDWPLCRLFSYLGLDRDLFRPLFAAARVVGWSAHALEQCETNEVIRPRARYRGAVNCRFEPLRMRAD